MRNTTPPVLEKSLPKDGTPFVAVDGNIKLKFSEKEIVGTGGVAISNGTDTRTIDIADKTGNAYAETSDSPTLNSITKKGMVAALSAVELSAIEQSNNNSGFVINGASANDRSGIFVSGAGDVNGDGLADVIVGAPGEYNDYFNDRDSSASYVVFGKRDGALVELSTVENGSGGFVINAVSAGDFNGRSVSGAGDVNGDGLADVIVGAALDDPNGNRSGASFVVFGKSDSAAVELSNIEGGNAGFVINGVSGGDQSGFSVSGAGDVNGDGLDDLIVGAYSDDPHGASSGASFVVLGKRGGAAVELSTVENGSGGFVINGISAGDFSGNSVSGAGDVNGDGLADVIVGAALDDPNGNGSGASFVVLGKRGGAAVELSAVENGSGGFVINGISAGDFSGNSVSGAGDVNGDGFADLIVGAYRADNFTGASFVVFGKTDGAAVELSTVENGSGGFVINGISARDFSGSSVSSAGDVNGDGFADLIVGASGDDPSGPYSGASFVVFGKTDGAAVELSAVDRGSNGSFVINGVSAYDRSGNSVSSAGDVNGDGLADLIVGASGDDPNGPYSGASFVIFGGQGTSATVGSAGNDTLTGDNTANQLVAGDGDDRLFGNGGADVLRGGAGNDILAVFDLAFASIDGGTGSDTLRFDGPLNADLGVIANNRLSNLEIIDLNGTGTSGLSIALTTDDILSLVGNEAANVLRINGDTTDTLDLSHADFQDSSATTSIDGITYAIYQSSGGHLDTSVRVLVEHRVDVISRLSVISAVELSALEQNDNNGGFVINGVSADDRSGNSVSSAGDVNGDGFADLIVGASGDDPNGPYSGASFVIFGGQGTSATVGSAGNDTLTGDNTANQLVAGDGDDRLFGNGGADVLRGGAGNDILAVFDLSFASLDGGTGNDALRFDAPLDLDLRVLADNKLNRIEIIDLTDDGGNSTLSLNLTDLIHLNEAQTPTDTLAIHGNSGDSVNLDNNSNGQTGSWVNAGGGVYEFNAGGSSIGIIGTVRIDVDVNVVIVT